MDSEGETNMEVKRSEAERSEVTVNRRRSFLHRSALGPELRVVKNGERFGPTSVGSGREGSASPLPPHQRLQDVTASPHKKELQINHAHWRKKFEARYDA